MLAAQPAITYEVSMKLTVLLGCAIIMLGRTQAAPGDFAAGVRAFFEADIPKALASWDRQIADAPDEKPLHWQRGLALYYAGKFQEGREQFEEHQKVNPQDVENAVWHFLCVARLETVEAARKAFIPITADPRVPMREIHALFAGKGSEEAVLLAADPGSDPDQVRNHRCYAHLYLGLYHEALGNAARAKEHLTKASDEFQMKHYMGRVAQVHVKLRGWAPEQ